MKLIHSLSSTVNNDRATIEIAECVTHTLEAAIDEALVDHYKTVVDTKERLVREGLIALGWTPPASLVLHSKRQRQPCNEVGSA